VRGKERIKGFEAESSVFSEGKVSKANVSETGRLRRRRGTTGEKESLPLRHESYIVNRNNKMYKTSGIRSRLP